ncbi:MAG: 16S rRNA (adenine(1518)-N(6)/adenine(1519)-N(6))-dimethyltransferase RsmA [Actinomycetota bacterium]
MSGPPTAREVRRLCEAHGIAPSRRRGQNFVVDPNTVRRVVARAGVGPGDLVAEIGPGLGALTLALVEAGAEVVAVEVDAGLVRALGEVLADTDGVTLHHADALEVDWAALLGGRSALLVANLPYHLATPLVIGALESGCFGRLEVMVQREVGERWTATAGHPAFSAASLRVAARAEAHIDGRVSRNAFLPVPGVDSVTVRLEPRAWTFDVARERVLDLVTIGFAQRRKRLRNALRAGGLSPAAIDTAFAATGLGADVRAEEVDLAGWVALARGLPATAPPA